MLAVVLHLVNTDRYLQACKQGDSEG